MARAAASSDCEIVVIGAGPYGLSIAAHLKTCGIAVHTFGEPMSFWRRNMPKGMKLRSPLRASNLSDPKMVLSLDAFGCSTRDASQEPLPIEDFIGYGDWFQTQVVPDLDRRVVTRIEARGGGFVAFTNDADRVCAKDVVIATGLEGHEIRPQVFAFSPASLVTHTSEHGNFDRFGGKRVAVIGRGQSACESAALLSETGAEVEIFCRGPIRWLGAGKHAVGWQQQLHAQVSRLIESPSAVGRFPSSWLVEAPRLVRMLPEEMRDALSDACLRAAAAGWLRPRFGPVRVASGVEVVNATAKGARMELKFADGRVDSFDHVILATGYKFDVAKLPMLAPELRASIIHRGGSPVLSSKFESSVQGLFFAGASAVSSFGPLMRFIAGTSFAARAVTRGVLAKGRSAQLAAEPVEYGLIT